jgi:DMSO reductase anchor subunit
MCSQRLEDEEAPACVQACPNEAIAIRIVERREVEKLAGAGEFVGGAPSPKVTLPTTRYKSARTSDVELVAVDRDVTRVEHLHLPLVIMLTLTQMGVGTLLVSLLFDRFEWSNPRAGVLLPAVAFGVTAVALLASVFHLGRPWLAWRAVLNLKTSWLSREALAFGVFAKSLALYCGSILLAPGLNFPVFRLLASLSAPLGIAASFFGLVGIGCSVMVYVATKRAHWAWSRTSAAFFGSLVLLGAAMAAFILSSTSDIRAEPTVGMVVACGIVIVAACGKLIFAYRYRRAVRDREQSVRQMVKTMNERLKPLAIARAITGTVGGIALPLWMITGKLEREWWPSVACAALFLVLSGEFIERMMFFGAAPASRMPGALP